jgi:hypothetical protein
MDFNELITALVDGDMLTARQWVADATRARIVWVDVVRPQDLSPEELAIAAGIAELLASRSGEPPPAWTADVLPAPEPVYLVRAARHFPRLRQLCEQEGPEPLRRRRVLAPPEFLTAA